MVRSRFQSYLTANYQLFSVVKESKQKAKGEKQQSERAAESTRLESRSSTEKEGETAVQKKVASKRARETKRW